MFADHIGVDVLRVHVEVPAQQRSEPRGVERRARADHAAVRNAASRRKVRSQLRHHVHRIGDDQQHRVRRMLEHGRHDLAEHVRVALQQLQSCLTRLLRDTAGNHDHARSGEVRVRAGTNRQWMRERHRVPDVVCLRLRTRVVHVHQHDFPAHAVHHQRVGRSRPDHPTSDDSDFHGCASIAFVVSDNDGEASIRRFAGNGWPRR